MADDADVANDADDADDAVDEDDADESVWKCLKVVENISVATCISDAVFLAIFIGVPYIVTSPKP